MQTITTKNIAATNHRPARIKATTSSGSSSVTISRHDPRLKDCFGCAEEHTAVARILIEEKFRKLDGELANGSWHGDWYAGAGDRIGNSLVWVNAHGWINPRRAEGEMPCPSFSIQRQEGNQ